MKLRAESPTVYMEFFLSPRLGVAIRRRKNNYVGYLSAIKEKKKQDARIYAEDEECHRKARVGAKKSKGKKKDFRIGGVIPHSFSMKRSFRLQSSDNITKVIRGGRKLESPFFRMHIRRNIVLHPRFAFIISKKVATRATVRNTMRRRAREWFRKSPWYSQSYDTVVTFKKGVENLSKKDFYEALYAIYQRLR